MLSKNTSMEWSKIRLRYKVTLNYVACPLKVLDLLVAVVETEVNCVELLGPINCTNSESVIRGNSPNPNGKLTV